MKEVGGLLFEQDVSLALQCKRVSIALAFRKRFLLRKRRFLGFGNVSEFPLLSLIVNGQWSVGSF